MYRLARQLTRTTPRGGGLGLGAAALTTRTATSFSNSPSSSTTTTTTTTTIRRFLFGGAPKETYSSLEYPTATEPPEITKTIAKDVRGQAPKRDKPIEIATDSSTTVTTAVPEEWIVQLRQRPLSRGVSAISATIPAEIPPNVPASQLERPEILITALDNGVRVVRYVPHKKQQEQASCR